MAAPSAVPVPALRRGTGAANASDHQRSGLPPRLPGRPIGTWAFAAVAICSLGGPLALAALNVPATVADAGDSAGLAVLASVVVFAVPLAIWLHYSRHVAGPGGLFGFVEVAAGRRLALVQAAVWIFSYLLYLSYTTVQIVYDLLPRVLPSSTGYQSALALAIPIALAAVMIAGRAVALVVLATIAAGQLALAGVLDAVTLAHVSAPVSSFGVSNATGSVAKTGVQTSLLYICGSLPLFLGGELAHPARTIRRGLTGALAVTVAVVGLAVAPLAAVPGLLHTDVPGVGVMQQFADGHLAEAIGVGIAVSIAGVMLCEYLALTRLIHAVGGWPIRPISAAIGIAIAVAAPFTLIDPEGFYTTLAQPSLVALWVSQLIVFVVYPRFVRRRGGRMWPAWALGAAGSAFAVYGIWLALGPASS